MSFIVNGIDLPKNGELHLIITKNGIIYGAEYPNKIKHAYPLNLEAQATQIPNGHGNIIDESKAIVTETIDGYYEITAPTILEAEK